MPQIFCVCCNKAGDDNKFVTCSLCKKNYYYSCADLSIAEVKSIKNKTNINFTCTSCAAIGDNITELKTVIISLQNEIEQLKSAIKNNGSANAESFNYEEIIQEISERNSRKNNLIIYGITEHPNLSRTDQVERDKNQVQSILEFLSPNIGPSRGNPVRLGRFDATKDKPRPVKLSFDSEEWIRLCIRNAPKLKTNNGYKNISVSFDRTPKQMDYYRKLKTELDARVAKGERLKIKYVRGLPSIVPLEN